MTIMREQDFPKGKERTAAANRRVVIFTIMLAIGFYIASFFMLGASSS